MKVKDLIPWGRREGSVQREGANAVHALQADLDHAFDEFWRSFGMPMPQGWIGGADSDAALRIDVRESPKEVEVLAELPGMDEKDVDIRVAEGTLTIRGEKSAERTKEEKDYVLRERSFGHIERVVQLPEGLDIDAANATFKNGVLTVSIPRTADSQSEVKHIRVQRG
jgi:HSP20 family protein